MKNNQGTNEKGTIPSSHRRRTWETRSTKLFDPSIPTLTTPCPRICVISSSHSSSSPTKKIEQPNNQTTKQTNKQPPKPKKQKAKTTNKTRRPIHRPLTLPQSLVYQLLPLHRPLPLEKRRRHAYRYVTAVRIVVRARHGDVVRLESRGYLRPAGVDYARRRRRRRRS
jgi:hypothetical protein